MDNITHTLAGGALAKAGLERRTPLAMPTLLVAANLPDIDALAYLRDPLFALTFRRGWTHGVLAMAVLPLVLAAVMVGWDGLVRRRRRPQATPASFRSLWLVSLIGVLSHPLLDLLNTYGVRLLMPFSERWFYSDTLFIIDPWLSGLLALTWLVGSVGSRREGTAKIVGGFALVYIAVMFGLGQAAQTAAAREAGPAVSRGRMMAAPVPVSPFRREVLFDLKQGYRWASFDWRRPVPRLLVAPDTIPRNFDQPAIAAVLTKPAARAFLGWSRFPAAVVTPGGVRLYDLRYADGETDSWASVVISAGSSTAAGSPDRRASRRWSPSK
jgi:inner membrane protein